MIGQITRAFADELAALKGQWRAGSDVSTEDLRRVLQHERPPHEKTGPRRHTVESRGNAPGAPWILGGLHYSGTVSVLVVVVVVTYVIVCAMGTPGTEVSSGRMLTVLPITRSAGTFDSSLIPYVTLLPPGCVRVRVLPAS
jgi:hypothetical protein